MENAYELGTPHGAVGRTVLPTLSWAFPPGARGAVPRVLGRFRGNAAGFALGTPLGPSCENSARAAYGGWISGVSAFGGRNGRFSSCFPMELGRPSGPQGAPQLKTSMNPNLNESHPNLHHGAVGGKFRPSASWGVRIGIVRVWGSISPIFFVFSR